jgi:hypothetical protein
MGSGLRFAILQITQIGETGKIKTKIGVRPPILRFLACDSYSRGSNRKIGGLTPSLTSSAKSSERQNDRIALSPRGKFALGLTYELISTQREEVVIKFSPIEFSGFDRKDGRRPSVR